MELLFVRMLQDPLAPARASLPCFRLPVQIHNDTTATTADYAFHLLNFFLAVFLSVLSDSTFLRLAKLSPIATPAPAPAPSPLGPSSVTCLLLSLLSRTLRLPFPLTLLLTLSPSPPKPVQSSPPKLSRRPSAPALILAFLLSALLSAGNLVRLRS